VDETLPTAGRCGVVAHELAHELLHRNDRKETTKQQRELEAESVAFAVMSHYGIAHVSNFYLASYDITPEMITASLQTISKTAKQIIEGVSSILAGKDGGQTQAAA
jgi:hypothetical protein